MGLFFEGPEKPFVKLRPTYSVKLIFSYMVKGIKIKTTAKFCPSRRLRFEDTKNIILPEMLPKSFGTFEKRAPGICVLELLLLFPSSIPALFTDSICPEFKSAL